MELLSFSLFFIVTVLEVFGEQTNSSKIIGGSDVLSAKEYPYQVSIQNGGHFCGGSIIHSDWVLTAAHCKVTVYSKILTGTVDGKNGGVTKLVSYVRNHPDFDLSYLRNDIAVVRVLGSFTFTEDVQPIKLAKNLPTIGSVATLTGWGFTSNLDTVGASRLQVIFVKTMSLEECQHQKTLVTSGQHVCTLNVIGEGACRGDSGSPLQINGEQFGIVSFGSIICANGEPTVYTNVPAFREWISANTGVQF